MILEGGQMGEVMGGYFIRRVVLPQVKFGTQLASTSASTTTGNRLAGPASLSGNNAENLISPIASRVARRTPAVQAKHRKSPLPDWYPRTPLRDISVICKAIERMNLRNAMTPQQMGPTSHLAKKPSPAQIQHQTPEPVNIFLGSQTQAVKPDPTVLDFTPIKVAKTPEIEAYEKKLTESIEKLEKIVKRNMKREKRKQNQNMAAMVSRREARCKTLMSMR
ncbi:hypothetical protein LUZ61_014614 [Rhynchospora tenuis]|uniref:Uncharacterized protein n=1 Tax=Rhynchospora tenuis TaxID=198213 RepID=A0AAD5WB24_9POAL|nr:hypothetical protein LUZ61_014614 [Rhynchospora tenuis]